MKAVMISIQPKWVKKILNGEKTLEVRKTVPKITPPFKCYIYCTLRDGRERYLLTYAQYCGYDMETYQHDFIANGKVVAEFVCDSIFSIDVDFNVHDELAGSPVETWLTWENAPDGYEEQKDIEKATCLTMDKIDAYIGRGSGCFCWHISDLKIYDKPKPLNDFYVWKKCNSCKTSGYESSACIYDEDCKVPAVVTRPPQSWCYVEEVQDGK